MRCRSNRIARSKLRGRDAGGGPVGIAVIHKKLLLRCNCACRDEHHVTHAWVNVSADTKGAQRWRAGDVAEGTAEPSGRMRTRCEDVAPADVWPF